MFASFFGVILAGIVMIVILFSMFAMIIFASSKSEPKIKDESVLVLKLDKPIYDREISSLSLTYDMSEGGFSSNTTIGLTEFITVINRAKNDDKIKAILLDLSYIQAAGWASIEEIREVLESFKASDKKIYAYSDSYTQNAYYLSTVADEIYLNPVGHIELKGLGGEVMYLKDMFKKFDIDIDLIRPENNAYKSAGEAFISTKMSDENREQIKAYLGSIWDYLAHNMSKSRDMDIDVLNNNVSSLSAFMPKDALENKFVDQLIFRTDLQKKIGKDLKNEKVKYLSYAKYRNSITDLFSSSKDKIAVIYAYGGVNQGKSGDISIGSETIVKEIRKAVDNKSVKAIVLRINSGGGDAIASELMTNEVFKAREVKPLIVSMGDVAASAGYEMAAGATKIVAMPITITGSIGVFGMLPNFSNALKKNLGINFDTVKTHNNSTFLTVTTKVSSDSRMMMQRNVEEFYTNFITRVADGRNLKVDFVDSIAKGRVWSGKDAKSLGLVDEFGGISKSIEIAAKEAGISDYSILMMPKSKDITQQLLDALGGDLNERLYTKSLGKHYNYFLEIKDITEMQGVQARMPYMISF